MLVKNTNTEFAQSVEWDGQSYSISPNDKLEVPEGARAAVAAHIWLEEVTEGF